MQQLDHNTQFAWRAAPFGRARKVPPFEAARWPVYERKRIVTPQRRDWTHEEVDRLVALLDQGYDYAACARRLGRTRTAIIVKTKRLHCKMTKRPTVLTAREVAALLGKGCAKSVAYWIEHDMLPARAAVTNGRRIWRVRWDDLLAFLHNESYWMAWDPSRITDVDLRAEMETLRADKPRWLTPGEVARRLHVGSDTVKQWIAKGFLPAARYGNWWVREDAIEGFVPPCERSRAGIPRGAGRRVVGKAEIQAVQL